MASPEYVLCLECETPCYVFDWRDGKIIEALCTTCSNDDPSQFATEEEYEALSMGYRPERGSGHEPGHEPDRGAGKD